MAKAAQESRPGEAAKLRVPADRPRDEASASVETSSTEQLGRAVNVQTVFLGIIAGILVLTTLYIAQTVAVPLVLACMLNLVLTPLVLGLARIRIPEPLGAALVVA